MANSKLTPGQRVRVRLASSTGEWCSALVAIASENGRSVALLLEGAVRARSGVITGMLPLTVDYDAETVTSLFGEEYEIETAPRGESPDAK